MRWQSTTWIIGILVVVLVFSNMTSARPRDKTSEFLEETVENAMSAAEILALLTQTVGPDAAGPSPAVAPVFADLFDASASYRATGVILLKLSEAFSGQFDLFGEAIRLQRLSNLYESIDTLREKYGKHTVFLGASYLAHTHAQHVGEHGHLPERQRELLPGETARKHLGIPMFMGEVT